MTSTTPTIQSASLHYREGNSDKEYHAAIEPEGEGYIVTFSYGRRGNTLTAGTKTPYLVTLHEATKVFDRLMTSKLAKGYQYSAASAGQEKPYAQIGNEGQDTGIRCQLLNAIEQSELSSLLTNRTHCLRKRRYIDRFSGLIMISPPRLPALRWVSTSVDPNDKVEICLSDELSPGICRHLSGRFCVIMPLRVRIPAGITREIDAAPSPQAQAA